MKATKLTPVLVVDKIEPCLEFWQRLGFNVTVEVPHGEELGFAILSNGDFEVMYQSRASVAADVAPLADAPARGTFLFIEVDDADAIDTAFKDVERIVPRRTTFYGADEIIVREPGGNVVTFAQMKNGG